ncbi:MAG: hypothetical protein RI922_1841 [Bacteroidota bacterium]|jgi:uncharacterized protein YjbI with pentapeptide repeats
MNSSDLIEVLIQTEGKANEITFNDSLFLNLSSYQHYSKELDVIQFENCTFNGNIILSNLNFDLILFSFENCTFNGENVTLSNLHKIYDVKFSNCELINLTISSSEIENCEITNCSINNEFNLIGFKGDFCEIKRNENNRTKINSIKCNSPELEQLDIDTSIRINKIRIDEIKQLNLICPVDNLSISSSKFERITIEKNDDDKSDIAIENFNLRSPVFDGQIEIYDVKIKSLDFRNVHSSKGSIRLNEVKLDETTIIDTTINAFYWNQIEFQNPPYLIRSDFSGLKMTNVKWDRKKKLKLSYLDKKVKPFYGLLEKFYTKIGYGYDQIDISEIQYQRDTYRQLKAASIANHNQIEALDFYRNEMRLYWKEVRINGGISWQNRMLVFLNRWSSDFGQNWILPIMWLFVFHALWFSCLLSFGFWSNSKTGGEEFAEYFKLLNPTHDLPCYMSTGFDYLTDIIMRVSIAYFVYHIIRATRKFGKV